MIPLATDEAGGVKAADHSGIDSAHKNMQHVTSGIYPLAFSSPSFKPRSIVCTVRPAFPPAESVCSLFLNDLRVVPETMDFFFFFS